ncbi:hypothetical protein, partial [Enterococcus faecium]|uniref:hypothetical protein n=1 Tax=Enterococcus faecium TaxID=1352 RepID=UPI00292EB977
IKRAKKAGIKTVMITGDHVVTASAIAKELGILNDPSEALSGSSRSVFIAFSKCERNNSFKSPLVTRVCTISVVKSFIGKSSFL